MESKQKNNYKQISVMLENAISLPPAKAGLRLLPEHELATRFNVGRMKMRRALDVLFDKGYLSRSRGCGTFLRKVIPCGANSTMDKENIPLIFDLEESSESRRTADLVKQKLHLSFWHNFDFFDTGKQILEGMKTSAMARGHSFSAISLMEKEGQPLSVELIRKKIQKKKYDGYLISARYAKLFYQALDGMEVNCTFVVPGPCRIEYEPLLQINLFEAVERAIRKLYESGFRKIAILSPERAFQLPSIYDETVAYDLVTKELGLKYNASYQASLDIKSLQKIFFDIFDSNDNPPDAIYIADEHFIPTFIYEMAQRNIKIGEDIGCITQHSMSNNIDIFNKGHFSCMRFDLVEFGAIAIDTLVQSTMTAGRRINNLSLNASWIPGTTHIKTTQ